MASPMALSNLTFTDLERSKLRSLRFSVVGYLYGIDIFASSNITTIWMSQKGVCWAAGFSAVPAVFLVYFASPVSPLFILCTIYVHCFTISTLSVHCIYCAPCMYTNYTVFTVCTLSVHWLQCAPYIYVCVLFPVCTVCALFTMCNLYAHCLHCAPIYALFPVCTLPVH